MLDLKVLLGQCLNWGWCFFLTLFLYTIVSSSFGVAWVYIVVTTLSGMAALWIEDRYSCDILMDCMAGIPCQWVFIWDTGIWGNRLNSLDVLLADSGKGHKYTGPFTVCLALLWALPPTHSSFDGVPLCSVYSFLNHGHGNTWMLQSNNVYLSYIPTSFPSFCLSFLVLTLPVSQFLTPFFSLCFLFSASHLLFLTLVIIVFFGGAVCRFLLTVVCHTMVLQANIFPD